MIVTVTPNPALDLTYAIGGDLVGGSVNRVVAVSERAGGKGVNVARILASQGIPVMALGPAGGATGETLRFLLDAAGVPHDLTPIAANTRRTVAVVDNACATGLWEPGPTITSAEWGSLIVTTASHLHHASVIVLAGSLPVGAPADGYADLVSLANAASVPVILDADGDALRRGLGAHPSAIKPNIDELATLTRLPVTDKAGAIRAARCARELGACDVVASLGPDGLVALTGEGTWSARPPMVSSGNATGAGDAAVAAMALGWLERDSWPHRLARMIAWSAAAAATPTAGEIDARVAVELASRVVVASH